MVGVIFLDLKKAFDTVDHAIMLKTLHKCGLSVNAVELFDSFINRTQSVKVQGYKSTIKPMVCGILEDSVLWPLLSILYINDLEEYLLDSRTGLYADDTAFFFAVITSLISCKPYRMKWVLCEGG